MMNVPFVFKKVQLHLSLKMIWVTMDVAICIHKYTATKYKNSTRIVYLPSVCKSIGALCVTKTTSLTVIVNHCWLMHSQQTIVVKALLRHIVYEYTCCQSRFGLTTLAVFAGVR